MLVFFLSIFRLVRLLMSGNGAVAMENTALRLQLAAFQRKRKRPVLTAFDRLFWVGLSLIWNGWRAALVYVQPDTVIRWQRERFRKFWARLSRVNRGRRGRPATAVEIRRLIERMVAANPLWRAPRIHGELTMLGIEISERTVSRILRTLRRPPRFHRNAHGIALIKQRRAAALQILPSLCAKSWIGNIRNRSGFQTFINDRSVVLSPTHQKQGPFPPPTLLGLYGCMTLSDFRGSHHPIDDVEGATFTTPGYPAINQITFPACCARRVPAEKLIGP